MNVLALIPARGGSKGIPRKNICDVGGRPLIAWTITAAFESRQLDRVVVSTDDEEIASVAREWEAEVPFLRPPELASDTAGSLEVVEHALGALVTNPDSIMLLQPTSPLRCAADIAASIDLLESSGADAVVSVALATHPPQWLRTMRPDGILEPWITGTPEPQRRQDGLPLYELNGAIYLVRTESLLRDRTFTPERTIGYPMPQERSIDVDTPWDLFVADLVLRERAVLAGTRR